MTKNDSIAVKKNEKRVKSTKVETPFTYPSGGQLLAYWHYKNNAKQPPDTWKISHTYIDKDAKDDKAGIIGARERESNSDLIKQLRVKNTGGSFSKTRYVRDVRLLCKWRILVGQKRDGCIQLDQQFDIERKQYLEIKRQYKECVSALESFLARDHEDSMSLLGRADAEQATTALLTERRDALSRHYGRARLDVYHWEEEWRTVKACHRFLHSVSPLVGNSDSDSEDEDERVSSKDSLLAAISPDRETRHSMMPRLLSSPSDFGNATSLESLIEAFEKEAKGMSKSKAKTPSDLGLIEAGDLLRLFRAIELQNLNALIHLESLGGPMAEMISRIDVAEGRVHEEIDDVLDGIKQLEASIEHQEKRAQRLKHRSTRLVQSNFRALVCSEKALHTRILVEDAYESCVAMNEAGLDPLVMAKTLEATYERLSAELDGLPRNLVIACEREGFQKEMHDSREAEEAAKKFELMHRLLAALKRILEPSEPRRRIMMQRSPPPKREVKQKSKRIDADTSMTARDILYSDFFGKSCKPNKDKDEASDDDENN